MDFLRGLGRFILFFTIGVMVTLWISIGVLQSTLLNQQTVKGWIAASGAYQHVMSSGVNLESTQGFVTQTDIKNALQTTFTPDYVQTQTETAVDATYDWINGKTQTVNFSIPIQDKRSDFSTNLQKQILPRIQALPVCTTSSKASSDTPTCLPPGTNAQDVATQYSQLADSTDFLTKPLTASTVFQGNQVPQNLSYLPQLVSTLHTAFYVLPMAVLLAGAGFILLNDDKFHGVLIIGRRVCFQGLLLFLGGIVVWYLGTHLDISGTAAGDSSQSALVRDVINPILQHVVPNVGLSLALFSGIVTFVGGSAWVGGFLLRRQSAHHLPKPLPAQHAAVKLPPPTNL